MPNNWPQEEDHPKGYPSNTHQESISAGAPWKAHGYWNSGQLPLTTGRTQPLLSPDVIFRWTAFNATATFAGIIGTHTIRFILFYNWLHSVTTQSFALFRKALNKSSFSRRREPRKINALDSRLRGMTNLDLFRVYLTFFSLELTVTFLRNSSLLHPWKHFT